MKGRWFAIILLIGLLLLLLWNVRERFGPNDVQEPTEPSSDPVIKKNYSPSQVDQMYDMLSPQEKNDWMSQIVSGRNPKDLIKKATSAFYWKMFINRPNTPVTMTEIDGFIQQNGLELQMDAFSRLTLQKVFEGKRYTPPVTPPATSQTSGTSGSATQLLPSCPAGFTPYVDEQGENMCYKETPARCRYNGYTDKGGAYCENSEGSRDSKCSYADGEYFPQTKMCRKKEYPRCPDGYHNLNGKCRSNTADEEEYQAAVAAVANSANVNPSVEAPTERWNTTLIYKRSVVEQMWNLLTPTQQTKLVEIFKQELSGRGNDAFTPEEYAKLYVMFIASSFYNEVYVKKTTPITEQDVDTALSKEVGRAGPSIKPSMVPYYRAILLNYFKGPGSDPGPGGGAGSGSGGATGSAGSAGSGSAGSSSSGSSAGSGSAGSSGIGMGGGDRLKQVFGPLFTGIGEGGTITDDSSSRNRYPELLGGREIGVRNKNQDEKGAMPTIGGLGGLGSSRFFPFSRVPGDMEKIPDPYRVSQTFTAANYSFKTDPVPFLTDFSAFFK